MFLIRQKEGRIGCMAGQPYIFHVRWIIDGYNVILADEKLSKLLRNDIEIARSELAGEVVGYVHARKEKAILIFDGKFSTPPEKISPYVEIRFSRPGETADEVIKREVGSSKRRRSLNVVSNDLAIVDYARECGAGIVGSLDFLSILRSPGPAPDTGGDFDSEKPAPTGNPDPELLRLFGGKKL